MAPVKREDELSRSEKFVTKQVANRASKVAGDVITARGTYTLLNPQGEITTVIEARYVPQSTITANEAALSMAREKLDRQSAKQRNVEMKVKGSPGKGKRYKSTTKFVRADRNARGKVVITPKGRDYLHSIESYEERRRRISRSRRNSRMTIIGGRTIRYGVPVLIVGWTVYDLIQGEGPSRSKEENLEYGLGGWAAEDATTLASIASSGKTTSLLTAGNFDWSELF